MSAFTFSVDDAYAGAGLSLGLARGLLCAYAGRNITQEGLGIGVPALRQGGFTCFATATRTERLAPNALARSYAVDRRMVWRLGGRPSLALTRIVERGAAAYMRRPWLQPSLLALASRLRRLAGATPHFEEIAPVAIADFTYIWDRSRVDVECRFRRLGDAPARLFVMNELGADFFRASWLDGREAPPPTGWQPLPAGAPALYDPQLGLRFSLVRAAADAPATPRLFWGRERNADCCWAGFELEFAGAALPAGGLSCRYAVKLAQGEDA